MSTTPKPTRKHKRKKSGENEVASVLLGRRAGRLWLCRACWEWTGTPVSVEFAAQRVLEEEGYFGDVMGFYHTHPNMPARPSERDIRTMQAWVGCLGKPLLCLIRGRDGLRGWVFRDDEDKGQPLVALLWQESFQPVPIFAALTKE